MARRSRSTKRYFVLERADVLNYPRVWTWTYATADKAEVAAIAWHKESGAPIDILFVQDSPTHFNTEKVATVITDALDRTWVQVTSEGGCFL